MPPAFLAAVTTRDLRDRWYTLAYVHTIRDSGDADTTESTKPSQLSCHTPHIEHTEG